MKYLRTVATAWLVGVFGCGPQAADQTEPLDQPSIKAPPREANSIFGAAFSAVSFVKKTETASDFASALATMAANQQKILTGIENIETLLTYSGLVSVEQACHNLHGITANVTADLQYGPDDPSNTNSQRIIDNAYTAAYGTMQSTYYNLPNATIGGLSFTPAICGGPFFAAVSAYLVAMDAFYPYPGFQQNPQFHWQACKMQQYAAQLGGCTKAWADSQCTVRVVQNPPDCDYSRKPPCTPTGFTWTLSCPEPKTFPFQVASSATSGGYASTRAAATAAGNAALAQAHAAIEAAWGVPDLADLATGLSTLLAPTGACPVYNPGPYTTQGTGACAQLGQ